MIEILNKSEKEKLDFLHGLCDKLTDEEWNKLQPIITMVKEFYQNKRLAIQAMEYNQKLHYKPNYDEM